MIDRAAVLRFLDGTEAGTVAAVDWLQEHGVALADVLLLYAGAPPDWLAPTFAEDEGLRLVVAGFCDWLVSRERGELVRACGLGVWTLAREHYEQACLSELPGSPGAQASRLDFALQGHDTTDLLAWFVARARRLAWFVARARRAQKRAVLALFPEVTARIARLVPVPRPGAETHLFGVKPDVTFRLGLDGAAVADIDVSAPDWIPPEPAAVDDYTDLDATADALSDPPTGPPPYLLCVPNPRPMFRGTP